MIALRWGNPGWSNAPHFKPVILGFKIRVYHYQAGCECNHNASSCLKGDYQHCILVCPVGIPINMEYADNHLRGHDGLVGWDLMPHLSVIISLNMHWVSSIWLKLIAIIYKKYENVDIHSSSSHNFINFSHNSLMHNG